MLRLTAFFALLAAPLAAQDKEMLCNTSAEIVQAAVDQRVGGADEETAIKNVVETLPDDKVQFKPAVDPLVEWVYTLEPEELTEEVSTSYLLACLSQ